MAVDVAEAHQSIFCADNEQVAVANNFIASVAMVYQQTLGRSLIVGGLDVDDPDAYYVYKERRRTGLALRRPRASHR